MTIQDWGISYAELEPYYDKFEYVPAFPARRATSRQGRARGNTFEGPAARANIRCAAHAQPRPRALRQGSRNGGYHPFRGRPRTRPRPYTNPDGAKFGACQTGGYCEPLRLRGQRQGQPAHAVIRLQCQSELRAAHATWVTRVLKDPGGKRSPASLHHVLNGEEFEQPASMVMLCAYAIHNVHLMLLSGIGQPYDP